MRAASILLGRPTGPSHALPSSTREAAACVGERVWLWRPLAGVRECTGVDAIGRAASLKKTCDYHLNLLGSTRYQISEPEVRGFMFWKNEPSQPKMTDPSYAAWIKIPSHCP